MTTIENRRFALLVAGGAILFLLYQSWQKDFAPGPAPTPPAASAPAEDNAPKVGDIPAAPASAGTVQPGAGAPAPGVPTAQRITVKTDLFNVVISTQGGDLRKLELLKYPYTKKQPDRLVDLLNDEPDRWFVVQSGITSAAGPIVSHKDFYQTSAQHFSLADGVDQLEVPLEFADAQGHRVIKTYRFHRGSYVIELNQRVVNSGTAALSANPYVQMWDAPYAAGEEPRFAKPFTGIGVYEQKTGSDSYRFRKVAFKDLAGEPLELHQSAGWLAMLQHYFFVGILPPAGQAATYVAKPSSTKGFLAQYIGAAAEIPAQGQRDFTTRLYAGPKLQQQLGALAPGLELTVDYGWLTAIAEVMFWLLNKFHSLIGNWGVSIILLTVVVRGSMFKLSEAQFRSMAKMKKYAPRIQELKDRYAEDRERLNKALMELYKKEKFNPLAGCWPLLVQMPVFFSLYWVLLESVELRQADFAFWIHDLSSNDPYFVLPVLFGLTMFLQQKLSGNVSMDPMQQRMMNVMPAIMTVVFALSPAGLVLYWVSSNLISITQQWYITRKLAAEGLSHR